MDTTRLPPAPYFEPPELRAELRALFNAHGSAVEARPVVVERLKRAPWPVLYDRRTGTFRVFPEPAMFVHAANARGWVAGETVRGHPVLLSESGPLKLPEATGMVNHVVTGLSDDGRVLVGYGVKGKRLHALVWHCR